MASTATIGESPDLLIRSWRGEDVDQWFDLSQDSGLNQFSISGYKMSDKNAAVEFIRRGQEIFNATKLGLFPIILKESSALIGLCGLKSTKLDDEPVEHVEVMYRLAQPYWGHGHATTASKLLLKYGFETLKLNRIVGFIVPDNIRSRTVLLRLGMAFVRNSSIFGHRIELYSKSKILSFEEFERVELRSGTILRVEPFPRAKKPAYKVWVDFGPNLGVKQTSAQITVNYAPESLVGRSVIGCLNLGTRNIGGFISEFLLTGFSDENGAIRLSTVDWKVTNGQKLH